MLLKIIGSVLLIMCGVGLGFYYGLADVFRKNELEHLKRAFLFIYSETEFGHTLLVPMCEKAARLCCGETGNIFIDFAMVLSDKRTEGLSETWAYCVERNCEASHLSKEDIEMISSVGSSLGVGDINRQLTAIKGLIDYINAKCLELSEISKKNMKLCKSTGILLSIFVVILLF